MKEFWKEIKGYECLYEVSNLGRVKSLNYRRTGKENILKPIINNGYFQVQLYKKSKKIWYSVHRLVAEAFLDNPDNLPIINHKDENPLNNNVVNLEWCSYSYNNNYGTRNQQVSKKLSKTVYQYTLNGELVKEWQSLHEVYRQLGYDCTSISACCRGKQKQSYGYKWTYK